MKAEELPQFLRTVGSLKGSFDPLHLMYHTMFRSGYLHFGLWSPERARDADLESLLDDVRAAQGRFADEAIACLAPGPQRVLDVGAGFGRLSAEMARRGHFVTAVTPCAYQAEQIGAQYPEVTVARGPFEEVALALPPASFDAAVFAESFRYMPLPRIFTLLARVLTPEGRVVIADWFAQRTAGTRHGHDHNETAFREAAQADGFVIVSERDVTRNVLPTVKLGYDVLCEFYLPLAAFVFAKFAQRRPRLFRLSLGWMIRWLERRVLPRLPGRFDPAVFAEDYRYFFFVLRRGEIIPRQAAGSAPHTSRPPGP